MAPADDKQRGEHALYSERRLAKQHGVTSTSQDTHSDHCARSCAAVGEHHCRVPPHRAVWPHTRVVGAHSAAGAEEQDVCGDCQARLGQVRRGIDVNKDIVLAAQLDAAVVVTPSGRFRRRHAQMDSANSLWGGGLGRHCVRLSLTFDVHSSLVNALECGSHLSLMPRMVIDARKPRATGMPSTMSCMWRSMLCDHW